MKDTAPIKFCSAEDSIFRAVVTMAKLRTGALIVRDGATTVGIVTERDVLDKYPFEVQQRSPPARRRRRRCHPPLSSISARPDPSACPTRWARAAA